MSAIPASAGQATGITADGSHPQVRARHMKANFMRTLFFIASWFGILMLVVLLWDVLSDGLKWLDWDFLTSFPSRKAEKSGIKAAIAGTLWLMSMTALISIPTGIAAAVYLEEFATKNRLSRFIEVNISNLAGVPSIVYGILGLELFIQFMHLGRSLLSGALTMSLLVLPTIILAAREAIKAVPDSVRQAAYAVGATKLQTIRAHVLPASIPGILTGVILAMSRALGETAPMIMIGALTYVAFLPAGPRDEFTTLPIQIYNWVARPQAEFKEVAAAGIIVLMAVLLLMNATAVFIRFRAEKNLKW
jgi:phosphate transport system permease protein